MSDQYLGEIRIFGFNFAPYGWAFCNGQTLPISQYSALFALLGTTYGGNGVSTFALPNLQSRMPLHFGQGPGLSPYALGEQIGTEAVTLLVTQLPSHNHGIVASSTATSKNPSNAEPAFTSGGSSYGTAADLTMAPNMVANAGGSQPHDNMPPILALNFCIALQGIFPSRN
jgi:microcystin-dependent protein